MFRMELKLLKVGQLLPILKEIGDRDGRDGTFKH